MGHIKLWDNMLDCPKINRLSDRAYRAWTKTLVTALRNGGRNGELPSRYDLAFKLRLTESEVDACVEEMHQCGLLDDCPDNPIGGMPYRIHDWAEWQTPKDKTAAERQARWRENQALRNAQRNAVTVPLITREITDKKEEGRRKKNTPPPPDGGRSEKPSFTLPETIDPQDWADYEEMRRKIRKPMTDQARRLAVAELGRLAARGHPPAEVLRQSILNSWQGLFEIRPQGTLNGFHGTKPEPPNQYRPPPTKEERDAAIAPSVALRKMLDERNEAKRAQQRTESE